MLSKLFSGDNYKRLVDLVVYGLIGFSLVYAVFSVYRLLIFADLPDFQVYYSAVERVIDGKNPYSLVVDQVPYIYPPTSLGWLMLLSILPMKVAEDFWLIVSVAALFASIILLRKAVEQPLIRWKSILLIIGLSLLAFPVKFTLGMGQINLFLLFLIILTFYLYQTKRLGWAGMTLAIAVSVKLTPVVFLLFFLRKNEWRVLISLILSSFAIVGLSMYAFGWGLTEQYWLEIFPSLPTIGNSVYYNQSLAGFLARLELTNQVAGAINFLVMIGLLAVSWLLIQPRRLQPLQNLLEFGLLIIIVLLVGGLTWQHHLVLLIIPLLAVGLTLIRKKQIKSWSGVMLIMAYLLVAFNIKQPDLISFNFSPLLCHGAMGMVVLLGLTVSLLKGSFSDGKKLQSG